MDLTDFNSNYLNKLLENIFKEQKSIFLLRDFNVKLWIIMSIIAFVVLLLQINDLVTNLIAGFRNKMEM